MPTGIGGESAGNRGGLATPGMPARYVPAVHPISPNASPYD
jgi:hypothetical protein